MTQDYDLLIIGGGINGCGIARDAAGRGLSVFLCEMNDLASGTSSWSTKLIHGGLRYLEYYEFRLVREALAEREVLMRKAHAALNEGGRVMTLEFIPNADRVSPPPAAMFALTMLATTPHGDAYTFAEYDQMFRNAGYSRSEHIPLHSSANSLVVSYK